MDNSSSNSVLTQLAEPVLTLLVVDDSEIDRGIYLRLLQAIHTVTYRILQAETLEEGWSIWQAQRPDIVFLDLKLPDGNGLEFLEAIQPFYADTQLPVIVLTGQGDERLAVRAMKLGATDYLIKADLTTELLTASVRQILDRMALARQLQRSQQHTTVMADIALRIRQFLRLDQVLTAIVQEVRDFLAADRVVIYRFNPDRSGIIVAESVIPPWLSCLDIHLTDTCFQTNSIPQAYFEGRFFVTHDVYTANLTPCHLELLERFQVRANLVVPILLPHIQTEQPVDLSSEPAIDFASLTAAAAPVRLWGLLMVHQCSGSRYWDNADVHLVHQLAVQSAIAIQQANLYHNLQAFNASLEQQIDRRTRELAASEQKFRGIFDNAQQFMAVLDCTGKLLEVNQTALHSKGLNLQQVINQPFWQTPWWDISQAVRDQLQAAIARAVNGETIRYEVELLSVDNQIVPVDLTLSPIRDTHGKVTMVIVEGRDISVAKRIEMMLRFQAQVLDQISDAVISINLDGIILTWNQGAEQLYGYTAQEMIGQPITVLYDDPAEFSTQILPPLLAQGHHTVEVRVRNRAGELLYVNLRLSVVRDEFDRVIRFVGSAHNITQQKQADAALRSSQEALRRSEAFNRLAVEASGIGTWDLIFPAQTCIISRQMAQLMGYADDQTIVPMQQWQASVFPTDRPVITAALTATIEHDRPFEVEFRIQLPTGEIRWLSSRGALTRDPNGQPLRIRGTSVDISDRKQMELALAELNQTLEAKVRERTLELQALSERLSLALTSGGIGSWVWDLQTNRVTWDERLFELYGLDPTPDLAIAYEDWRACIHPDDLQFAEALLQQILVNNVPYQTDLRIYRPDGSLRHLQSYAMLIRGADQQPQRMIGVNIDITDLKQAEAENHQLRERLEFVLSSSPAIIFTCQPTDDYAVTFVNDNVRLVMGYEPEEVLNDPQLWNRCLHPDDAPRVLENLPQIFQQDFYIHEYRFRHQLGHYLWLQSGLRLMRDAQGNPIELVGYTIDISDRKEAELQLQRSNAELIRATRLKDEFLANISHELRTPLSAILGITESLQEEILGPITDSQRQALQTIETSGTHLLCLLTDLLDLSKLVDPSKLEASQAEFPLAPTPVEALCRSSLNFVQPQAQKKRIRFQIKLPRHPLPDLVVDERRIRQVLINLLSNAVKFTPPGGQVTLEVSPLPATAPAVQADSAAAYLRISVTDTGIGIAPANLKKLFKPFVQIDTALNRQYEGTGLGLVLVKQMVELHGGTVDFTSEEGIGSCFSVTLPCTPNAVPADAAPSAVPTSAPPPAITDRTTQILLVDDNPANMKTTSGYLQARGYVVWLADKAADAIARLQTEQPDLILIDISMSGMDGLDLIQRIRALPNCSEIPIIALTSFATDSDRDRYRAAGATDYLPKPLQLKQLTLTIQRHLQPVQSV